jgi:hypothetical protein
VFPCDLQEHYLYLAWFRLGIDQIVWLGEIICHRWLFEQLLVPSVRQVAQVKLSPDPTTRRSGKPLHLLGIQSYGLRSGKPLHLLGIQSYGLLGRIFTLVFPFVYYPNLKIPKISTTHNPI